MYHDLNILWTPNSAALQQTLAFAAELGYTVVALNHVISEKLPSEITCAIPNPLPCAVPSQLRIVRRCTLLFSDTGQNHRLAQLASCYDLLALRPTNAKALQLASQAPETDLISLDMTLRHPYHFRPRHFATAHQRGVRLELAYGAAVYGGPAARRNALGNATSLVRATRGRGLILSSEAARGLACRAPPDAVNLAAVWGMAPDRAQAAVAREPAAVLAAAMQRRTSFRGVIAVVGRAAEKKPQAAETATEPAAPAKLAGPAGPAEPAGPADATVTSAPAAAESLPDAEQPAGPDQAHATLSKRPLPPSSSSGGGSSSGATRRDRRSTKRSRLNAR